MSKQGLIIFVIIFLLSLARNSFSGLFFTFISKPQNYVIGKHESLTLECQFSTEYFYLFDNPVVWVKNQNGERTNINVLSNINPPFITTGRFEATFNTNPPVYTIELRIKEFSEQCVIVFVRVRSLDLDGQVSHVTVYPSHADVLPEDSANYSCEVRDSNSGIIGSVTHRVYVRSPVNEISINQKRPNNDTEWKSQTNTDVSENNRNNNKKHWLSYIENQPGRLLCSALGGYPRPKLRIYIGRNEVTANFTLRQSARVTGSRGLRSIDFRSQLFTSDLMARPQYDGQPLQCVVSVPGLPPNVTAVKLRVRYKPVIVCYSSKAYLQDKSVSLRCEIMSKPLLTSLYWIIDDNGTTVSEGNVVKEYWTLVREKQNGLLETQLFTRYARAVTFRSYTVVARNGVGESRNDVKLVRGYRVARPVNDKAYDSYRPNRGYSKSSARRVIPASAVLIVVQCLLWSLWQPM